MSHTFTLFRLGSPQCLRPASLLRCRSMRSSPHCDPQSCPPPALRTHPRRRPSILDAAVFEHLMRVQNSPADAWLKESGYAKLLESHRQVVLTRYFGGVGISRPQDALAMLGPHWVPVAGALTGTDKHDESGLNYIAIGLAAVIIGAAGYFAVSTAARGGEMQVASAASK